MKKPKTKKPRRKTRAERKANPGRPTTPVATLERSPEESSQGSREAVYIRFGEPPESGISQNGIGGTRGYEAGVSCFLGWRVRSRRGTVSYEIDVPRDLKMEQLIRQGQYLLIMLMEGRLLYVLEGARRLALAPPASPCSRGPLRSYTPLLPASICPSGSRKRGERLPTAGTGCVERQNFTTR